MLLNLGLASRSIDRLELSAFALKTPSSLIPQVYGLGVIMALLAIVERFDSAVRSYKHALSLDENHGASLVNLAMSLNASNRHSESISIFRPHLL